MSLNPQTKYFAEEKIWRGPAKPAWLFNDKVNLGRIVLGVLKRDPEKVIQISDDNGVRMTNLETAENAEKIACGLRRRGCERGDVVGFVARNGHNLAPALLGCFFLEAPTNAMDVFQNEDELYSIFKITKPKFIFCDNDMVSMIEKIAEKLPNYPTIVVFGKKMSNYLHIEELMREGDSAKLLRKLYEETSEGSQSEYQIIVCSSGTTGSPKAVALPYQTLVREHWFDGLETSPEDCFFSFCPPFWSVFYVNVLKHLFAGVPRVITTDDFSPETYLKIVEKYNVTHTLVSSIYLNLTLQSPEMKSTSLLNIKQLLFTGSLTTDDLAKKLMPYIPNADVYIAYGMSEIGNIAMYKFNPEKPISVGCLLHGVQGIVLSDEGKRLGPGQSGELCFKTPKHMFGYLENPVETENAFTEEGFFRTGDLGFYNEDGFLHIVGRSKDVIKYYMTHVSASEIERVIKAHPHVQDAVAVGIRNDKCYQLPAAVVTRKKDANVTAKELSKLVEENLPDNHKLRGGIYFVDNLQTTFTGKLKKKEIEKYATKMYNSTESNTFIINQKETRNI
ncbi:luciferin 4-monooxygenase-like [Lutzomyia longipalpis]|uniref:luciferin 4-monooxygenase-like n=1 Tax=Lutzomyia longipalpis TaxID=7200 RepID=UPI0024837943|nr:luciferin 4-monooxygenase-like [Lutzomyia longipalpis]